MLLALVLSQAIGVLVSWDERGQRRANSRQGRVPRPRPASLASARDDAADPRERHPPRQQHGYTRYWVSREPVDSTAWRHEAWALLTQPCHAIAVGYVQRRQELQESHLRPSGKTGAGAAMRTCLDRLFRPHAWPLSRPAKFLYLDESWHGPHRPARTAAPGSTPPSPRRSERHLDLADGDLARGDGAILSLIAVLAARGITRPMRRLAVAAEALGRGEAPSLPETGPDDIRQTAEAFNRMQERLQRFVADRTRMLAAIGHDLRTPLTSLRLRAEFVGDADVRRRC